MKTFFRSLTGHAMYRTRLARKAGQGGQDSHAASSHPNEGSASRSAWRWWAISVLVAAVSFVEPQAALADEDSIAPASSGAQQAAQCTTTPDFCAPDGFIALTFRFVSTPDQCRYNVTVNFGDGTTEQFTNVNDFDFSHQYAQPGVYNLNIRSEVSLMTQTMTKSVV